VLLVIDNYDSFTFNLVQRIGEHDLKYSLEREIKVIRNDQITISDAIALKPSKIIISPGPCTPEESGISRELIKYFNGTIPILGVCLGHQAIASLFGMPVMQYEKPVHGKTSEIYHNNTGVFKELPNPFTATRYHSLVVDTESIASDFEVNAWTDDGKCMGLLRKTNGRLLQGVQFHPESFLTDSGPQLIRNYLLDES